MREYVVGLVHDGTRMAFIEKKRPEWQAGKLNGIGGKIEPGESPLAAMQREFREETGYTIDIEWRPLAIMNYPGQATIMFFTAHVATDVLFSLESMTDERVRVHSLNYLLDYPNHFIHNLKWLVPLAIHTEEYAQVTIIGHTDPVNGKIKENSTL